MVIAPVVKHLKSRNALAIGANNLRIHNSSHVNSRGFLYDQRIALRPVRAIHCVKPHPSIANMDLQLIAVMLQLMCPGPLGGLLARVG